MKKNYADMIKLYVPIYSKLKTYNNITSTDIHSYMIQSFRTDVSLQTEEQSDQGLHCLLFHLHLFDEIPSGLASFLEF